MKKKMVRLWALFTALVLLVSSGIPTVSAANATVESVTEQLQAIDSLQTMLNKRYSADYTLAEGETVYNVTVTNQSIIDKHRSLHKKYANYLASMNAARAEAQLAYNSLTDEQKAQIDPVLVAKLTDKPKNKFLTGPFAVTPSDDGYPYEVVKHSKGFGYEASNYGVSGELPQTFVLVDTRETGASWTPTPGEYKNGESNFEVAYCCDFETSLSWSSHYRRLNLEDATYFDDHCAERIRAIVQSSYPYITEAEMKAKLKADGMDADFVDSLNRSDMISAVQLAIWQYSNYDEVIAAGAGYYATVDVTKNSNKWFTPVHDFSNEIWEWFPAKGCQTYTEENAYRVNNLYYHLANLEGVKAEKDQTIITNIKVGRLDLKKKANDIYSIGLHITLNSGCTDDSDDVTLKVESISENGVKTAENSVKVGKDKEYVLAINAKYGDTIKVTAVGSQTVDQGVYFYDAVGGRKNSQSLVAMGHGETNVNAVTQFTFNEDIEKGIRIYKKSTEDNTPISDITFNVYKVTPNDGETINDTPTAEEITRFAVPENLMGTMVTDITGYAALKLPSDGIYLVVEEHNAEKVKAPADPFYITIPWAVEEEVEGEKIVKYYDVVEVYPKNTPVTPPPPPPPPPPQYVNGRFKIVKYDNNNVSDLLEGAKFQVYKAATPTDTDTETILHGGQSLAVVPVMLDDAPVILVTDDSGTVTSPELPCGTYFIKEIKAPNGYVLPKEAVEVSVESGVMSEATITKIGNDRGIILPATGGIGVNPIIIAGVVIAFLSAVFIITKKRLPQY